MVVALFLSIILTNSVIYCIINKKRGVRNMAVIHLQGTEFEFSVLGSADSENYFAKTKILVNNEYISYNHEEREIAFEEIEEWIFTMSRVLAGAYGKEYSLAFEGAGIAVDIYPYTKSDGEATRQERRENDCIMALRILMRSKDTNAYLGGVYSLLFHRKEIETFVAALREEFYKVYIPSKPAKAKYLFVGVSPKGYKGCNYWYLDKSGESKAGDYVWVRMGRHNTEQIVYVDNARWFDKESAPYEPAYVKQVLRKATDDETEKW